MTRKESEKDSDRPHYYSQFWLDIAAGRRTIGGPRPNDEADTFEPELELDNVALRRPGRNSSPAIASDYEETIAHPEVEPEFDADEYAEPAFDETDLDNEIEDEEDEDDMNWNAGRGKKKPKPRGGAAKLPPKPPVKKPGKRDSRRGF